MPPVRGQYSGEMKQTLCAITCSSLLGSGLWCLLRRQTMLLSAHSRAQLIAWRTSHGIWRIFWRLNRQSKQTSPAELTPETTQSSLSSGIMPTMNSPITANSKYGLNVHAHISDFVALRQVPMLKVEFERVFAVLQLLPIVRLQGWAVKVVTDRGWFIGNFVALWLPCGSQSRCRIGWATSRPIHPPPQSPLSLAADSWWLCGLCICRFGGSGF